MKLKVMPFAITWAENWPLLKNKYQYTTWAQQSGTWASIKNWSMDRFKGLEPRFGWRLWPQFWQMKRLGWWDHSVVEKGTTFPYYSSTKRVRPKWNCHSMTFHTFAWQILWHQGFSLHFFAVGMTMLLFHLFATLTTYWTTSASCVLLMHKVHISLCRWLVWKEILLFCVIL